MAGRLYNTPFVDLLPGSISTDPTIRAAAASLDGVLRSLTLSVPNLLLYSRLLLTAGRKASTNLLPALQRIIDARGGLKPLGTAELELLAWQFHVDFREVAKTDAQLAEMIVQSIPWHRIKGTPASVRRALALFGYEVAIEEANGMVTPRTAAGRAAERAMSKTGTAFPGVARPAIAHPAQDAQVGGITTEEDGTGTQWACYQLDLKNVLDMEDVQKVFAVAREMAPVRCRLWRVYNADLDLRPIRLSLGPGLSLGYLSAWSGVPVPDASDPMEEDVLVSLGRRLSLGNAPHSHHAGLYLRSALRLLARRRRAFYLSRSPLSLEILPPRHGFMFAINLTLGEGHAHEPIPPRYYSFSKSQAVLSESWAGMGQENCRLSMPFDRYLTAPFALSFAALSTHDAGYHCDPIHEFTQSTFAAVAPARPRPAQGGCMVTNITISADVRRAQNRQSWPATATARRWWPHVGHNLTEHNA